MKLFRIVQLKTLRALCPPQGGALPCRSVREVADAFGRSEGAVRHRLMRYARKGWLLRVPGPAGYRYQLLPRGAARLHWLQTQRDPVAGLLGDLLE